METIPDDVLLSLAPEELASILLKLAQKHQGIFTESIQDDLIGQAAYPYNNRDEIEIAFREAWGWLRINILIVPASEPNGRNGYMVLSRRGAKIASEKEFQHFREAAAFPKTLLHPSIGDKVWLALARGDLDGGVFAAFKAVEEAVRHAGSFGPTDIGVPLMRKAFDKTAGPLSDPVQPEPEREALAHLFAGAIGSYKNPHSHRTDIRPQIRIMAACRAPFFNTRPRFLVRAFPGWGGQLNS